MLVWISERLYHQKTFGPRWDRLHEFSLAVLIQCNPRLPKEQTPDDINRHPRNPVRHISSGTPLFLSCLTFSASELLAEPLHVIQHKCFHAVEHRNSDSLADDTAPRGVLGFVDDRARAGDFKEPLEDGV